MKKPPATANAAKGAAGMLAGLQAGHAQAKTDRKLAGAAEAGRTVALVALGSIQARAGGDSRPSRADHVLALAESVAAVGLLQPPAVDKAHRLVAGLNRLHACRLLVAAPHERGFALSFCDGADKLDPEETKARLEALPAPDKLPEPLKSGKVPVRVLLDLDAEADPDAALAAEAAENTARKAYSAHEVAALVERLRRAGYRETTGRPRKGEKALRPALGLVLGIGADTARRLLGTRKDRQRPTFSEKPADVLTAQAERLTRALAAYMKAAGDVALASQSKATRRAVALADQLADQLKET